MGAVSLLAGRVDFRAANVANRRADLRVAGNDGTCAFQPCAFQPRTYLNPTDRCRIKIR
jgi:hypothetical protein